MKCVNIIMINVQDEYRGLLSGILHGGAQKDDRTGTGTQSVFGRMLRHDMAAGFPLLTTKKYISTMQLQNYYGYYRDALTLLTCAITALLTGILIISGQVEQMVRLALFMGSSLGTSMVLINLKKFSSKLNKNQHLGASWQAYGIPMIWMIWHCLLVIIAFKYI